MEVVEVNPLEEGFKYYALNGKKGMRGTGKMKPITLFIKKELEKYFSDEHFEIKLEYLVPTVHTVNKARTIEKKKKKKTDIAVVRRKDKVILAVIELKWCMSSYQKNETNAIENMVGYSVNIKQDNPDIFSFYWNFLFDEYTTKKGGVQIPMEQKFKPTTIDKLEYTYITNGKYFDPFVLEKISSHELEKYVYEVFPKLLFPTMEKLRKVVKDFALMFFNCQV